MTCGNPIVDSLQQVLTISFKFSVLRLDKKFLTTSFNDFQESNSVELSFLVNWSSSNNFQIFSLINIPSLSLASLSKGAILFNA